MAKRKKRKNIKKNGFLGILVIALIVVFNLYGNEINNLLTSVNLSDYFSNVETEDSSDSGTDENNTVNTIIDGDLKVYFLNVGQADSILIQVDDENMLIDAGNNEDGSKLVTYFESLGIEEFKYVVGTHPHEDHIGGLDDIINSFDIDKVYLPDAITTTATFEDVLDAIESKNMTYTVPTIGEEFTLGDATFEVLYTGTDTSDLNNTSIVLKMTYGSTSFLFMGDATSKVENIILDDDIDVDVLKVGHHGSSYSSTEDFLNKVSPTYAIISCGKNNSYGHPTSSTLSKLNSLNATIYRTDEDGTILVVSDGTSLTFTKLETDTNG